MTDTPLRDAGQCSIPHHAALVVDVLAVLQRLDVLGLLTDRDDPTEYLPEVPGLVSLIINNNVTEQGVNSVFDEMFESANSFRPSSAVMPGLLIALAGIRNRWLRWQFLEHNIE